MPATTALEAKVEAVNAANKYANELYPILREIFTPFVGEKVINADGQLMKKIRELLPNSRPDNNTLVYRQTSDYSLAFVVKTDRSYPTGRDNDRISMYSESTVYVGKQRHGVLVELSSPPTKKPEYKVDEVLAARKRYEEVLTACQDAESALSPFGRYDH